MGGSFLPAIDSINGYLLQDMSILLTFLQNFTLIVRIDQWCIYLFGSQKLKIFGNTEIKYKI